MAFLGSVFPAVLFNVKRSSLVWVGICGTLGYTTYYLTEKITGKITFATFIGALIVGVFSEGTARILKIPATIFSVSGSTPLVPGIAAYTTIQYVVENKLSNAASKGIETLSSALAIAFGIMLASAIFRVVSKIRLKYTVKHK